MMFTHLSDRDPLPAVLHAKEGNRDLIEIAKERRSVIKQAVREHGAVLFRGFTVDSAQKFNEICRSLSDELLDYTERSTPRSHVSGNVFTSTEYPPEATIPLHCEMAYSRNWPRYVWFYAHHVAEEGGETPICDARKVYQLISQTTRQRFADKGVMYVRNFRKGIDIPWQEVYGVENKQELEAYCQSHAIEIEWREENVLRTRAIAQAVVQHPETGDMVWFNQAHLFHVSTLPAVLRKFLVMKFKEDGVPRNSFYGDGSPIENEVLEEIRRAYAQTEVRFPWCKGDVLMVDNMQISHGRRPFRGERRTFVAMAEAFGFREKKDG